MELVGKGELRKIIAFLKNLSVAIFGGEALGWLTLLCGIAWTSWAVLMDPRRNGVQACEELQCVCFKQNSKTKTKLLCYHLKVEAVPM